MNELLEWLLAGFFVVYYEVREPYIKCWIASQNQYLRATVLMGQGPNELLYRQQKGMNP